MYKAKVLLLGPAEVSFMLFMYGTRHRASTSMYTLQTNVLRSRYILLERHQWKPAVQAATVILRTAPVDG